MQRFKITQPSQPAYQDYSAKPRPSSATSTTPPPSAVPENTERAPDRPPSWLARPYSPLADQESGPVLRKAKSTLEMRTKAARQEKEPAAQPEAPGTDARLKKSRSTRSLRDVKSFRDIKEAMASFRKAKPSASTDSPGDANAEESLDEIINPETGLTRRDAYKARLRTQKAMEDAGQEVYEKFLQMAEPERDLRIAYIREEKMEEMIDDAIKQNQTAIAKDKSIKGTLSAMRKSTQRKEQDEHKHLGEFSRDQWREKLLGEQGEPEVNRKDIIALMQKPEIDTRIFNFGIRTGRMNPVGLFQKELERRGDQYRKRKDEETEYRAEMQRRREKKAPDPYNVSDDSDDSGTEKKDPVVEFAKGLEELNAEYRMTRNADNVSPNSIDSLQPEFGSAESRMTLASMRVEDGSIVDGSR